MRAKAVAKCYRPEKIGTCFIWLFFNCSYLPNVTIPKKSGLVSFIYVLIYNFDIKLRKDTMTIPNNKYPIKIITKDKKKYIFDVIRKKHIVLTPEEWVRQNFIKYLVEEKAYPSGLIGVEQQLPGNDQNFRTDIVIYSRTAKAIMIIECKSEKIKISQDVFDQAAKYNFQFKANYLVVTNGINHYICKLNYQEKSYIFMKEVPDYKELLENERK